MSSAYNPSCDVMYYIEPGETVGELETFRLHSERCMTVQARTAVTAYELSAEDFDASFEHPAVRCSHH